VSAAETPPPAAPAKRQPKRIRRIRSITVGPEDWALVQRMAADDERPVSWMIVSLIRREAARRARAAAPISLDKPSETE
jgi:hypothetical protein